MYIGTKNLKLDKLTGLRPDKKAKQIVPFAKSTKLPESKKAMKASANVTSDGYKK